jgi:hypothetical protein
MQVRAKKKASPKGQTQSPQAQQYAFAAPIRGLVMNENIAQAGPGGAEVLDNWICTTTGAKVRGGTVDHVPLGAKVRSMFVHRSSGVESAFGATSTAIYPITSPSGTTPTAAVTGQTSGVYSAEQFGTAGGDFLYAVNGTDLALLFDGTTWTPIDGASTPAITGVATSDLSYVWSFASRLFFIKKGTLSVFYLPVDSIGGAAQEFSLAGIFKKGGVLLFGATWSMDAGDGLDDKCVFVSDQGEVAIYEGTNPGSAATWSKAGVYQVTQPLGARGKMQAGGDLLIATQSGLVPISQAIQRDVAALEMGAVSKAITPLWQERAFNLSSGGWEIEKWPTENIMVVSQPGDRESTCLIANLQTGAWSRFTGINVQSLAYFDGSVFFGGVDGMVRKLQSGGSDSGANYTAAYLGKGETLGLPGMQKTVAQMRATFRGASDVNPLVTAKTDYVTDLSLPPNASMDTATGSTWGAAVWGVATWGGAPAKTQSSWTAVGRTGYAIAPEVQLTFGSVTMPDVELVGVDATFHAGALVT